MYNYQYRNIKNITKIVVERSNMMLIATLLLTIILNNNLVSGAENQTKIKRLSLLEAVTKAQQNDIWLVKNQYSQDSIDSMGDSVGYLPDPKISLGLQNIAADSFDFGQEPMTSLKFGVTQMFPRGDTLDLKQKKLKQLSEQFPYQRENRRARVVIKVANLWFDAYNAQQSIRLIEDNRALFEQLSDVAQASYSSAVGKTRQQDIVRAELELVRLDDRLTMLLQKRDLTMEKISEWMISSKNENSEIFELNNFDSHELKLSEDLPIIQPLNEILYTSSEDINANVLITYFSNHPSIQALNHKVMESLSGIELARQKYKAQWGVTAGYGFRDQTPSGINRSDLFSIGVSFDLPIFGSEQQDSNLQSAISKSDSVKTEKWLMYKQMIGSFEANRAKLRRLVERQNLYQKQLLPQIHEQAEASLTAYTNDDGDFAEVVRARIAELNAQIDALGINVEVQKSIVQLNYFFMAHADEIVKGEQK